MTVWEFKPGNVNDYAPLVFTSDRDIESGRFESARDLWRLQPLRRWSHEQVEQVLT